MSGDQAQEDFLLRLKHLAGLFNNRHHAAQAAGVSVDSLQRYLRGEVAPTFTAMAGLCRAAGRSLDWLAGGYPDTQAREVCARIETLAAELSDLLAVRRS